MKSETGPDPVPPDAKGSIALDHVKEGAREADHAIVTGGGIAETTEIGTETETGTEIGIGTGIETETGGRGDDIVALETGATGAGEGK